MKLLIAEDEAFNQIVLRDMLELLFDGIETKVVSNGIEALESIKDGWPDIVLSDVDMPKLRGDDMVKIVRDELGNDILPVICITAFAISGDKERLLSFGFDDYISKPIDLKELEKVLKKYI